MKSFAVALSLALVAPALIVTASPVLAETVTAPTPAPALSLDTPIEALMADERSKAVLEANMPGVDKHPMYEMIKGMSLRQLQPMSQGAITEEMLAKIEKELAAIK